jgi:cobyrinic acid a,c-diamide synthase
MKRIMIAGTNSGCGKTTVTCGILQALVDMKKSVGAFKCGPDYIDPIFHSKIIGANTYNLDNFFCDENMIKYLFKKNSLNVDISVIEGVMGFYDGVSGKASSYDISNIINCAVVIVIDCEGMSSSVGAVIKGFLTYKVPNNIIGFIFNRLHESLLDEVKNICINLKTSFFGYLPMSKECVIESRHLGLSTTEDIVSIKNKMNILSDMVQKNIYIDEMIRISESFEFPSYNLVSILKPKLKNKVKIAVANDNAFCFIYEDNLNLLREMGCEIEFFSPLKDEDIPKNSDGLILCGGYPELFAKELFNNNKIRKSIYEKILEGIPVIAECGGFMYLHKLLEDINGEEYEMVGIVDAKAFRISQLQRFGYITLKAKSDNLLCKKDEEILAHEFHYWDSTKCGDGFDVVKAGDGAKYKCAIINHNMYASFPHLYFYANTRICYNFVSKCDLYRENRGWS